MNVRYAVQFLGGAARKAWLAWRAGRLSLSPSQWLMHVRNYYGETAPLPFAGAAARTSASDVPPLPDGALRFLVITDYVPMPDRDSGSVRLAALLRLLTEMGFIVTLASHDDKADARYAAALERIGVEVIQGPKAVLAHLTAQGHGYRYALLSRPQSAYRYLFPIRTFAVHATVFYDTVDLHWIRTNREADVTGDAESRKRAVDYRRIEQFNVEGADEIIAITEPEREALLAMQPSATVHVIPNIHRVSPVSPPWRDRRHLLFIGSFLHPPNADAVRFFIGEVLPLIHRELPDVRFTIVGHALPPEIRKLRSAFVDPVGYVADADPYFARARVFVCPLRYGAGMKGKIGHSMSLGLPVVTTAVGAEGMRLIDGETALIADGADAFANAVVRVYRDEPLWTALADRAKEHVAAQFSEDAVRQRLQQIFPPAHPAAERLEPAGLDARRA